MEKYKEEINKIIVDYRQNAQAAAKLYTMTDELKNSMKVIEADMQKLSAELLDIRSAEKELFDRMTEDGVDIEAVKTEIEQLVKNAI